VIWVQLYFEPSPFQTVKFPRIVKYSLPDLYNLLYLAPEAKFLQAIITTDMSGSYAMSGVTDSVSRIFPTTTNPPLLVGVTALTTFALIAILRLAFKGEKVKIIKSPTATLLPRLSSAEKEALPYPPDALPGGRDVHSPVRMEITII
jgi:hypothetical protein